ncbi:MAG: hypothetical protein Q8P24_09755 [Desulfobacterales bacterium]|nr:hypothetical protein [Desulfobacterales bacterium]
MNGAAENMPARRFIRKPARMILLVLIVSGVGGFMAQLAGNHPERAWQTYLINFLLWSAMAQGAVLFSVVMVLTQAKWSGPMQRISEAFAAFFPVSLVLYLVLFLGRKHLFPWLGQELHGKAVWLNVPFLFTRDFIGLLVLYGLGLMYVAAAVKARAGGRNGPGKHQKRIYAVSVLYCLVYALVLSLIGFDLVMGMDPHWVSTLFGAYSFIKAFFVGIAALIVTASFLCLRRGKSSVPAFSQLHNMGKLLFAFSLLWAYFFYTQFVVIWYGNLPEETGYVITRTMTAPWKPLAWLVLALCFLLPFFMLLNRAVKTKPLAMMLIGAAVIAGIWLEHLLLIGPALTPGASRIPLNMPDVLITLGFAGLVAAALLFFQRAFPDHLGPEPRGKPG